MSCCGHAQEESVEESCEYYGCLPKLVPLVSSPDTLTVAPLGPSILNTLTARVPVTCADSRELPPRPANSLRIVVVSDTHERHREMVLPPGDVLVHAGDIQEGIALCGSREAAVRDFFAWFNDPVLHPHPAKLVIAGNHDKVIARLSREEVRRMAAPALYLHDESAVLEPCGLRFYGSPRSTANSRLSPNGAFQSPTAWRAFPAPSGPATHAGSALTREKSSGSLPGERQDPQSSQEMGFRIEGEHPQGPVDVLITHQTPEFPSPELSLESQPIVQYINAVAPRRLHLGGHLHLSRGLHRIPAPPTVADTFGYVTKTSADGKREVQPLPFFPSLNAAMLSGPLLHPKVQPCCVIDLEL